MAGSQLKQLKAALKSQGLIGQTNTKKKNQKSKTPHDTRRDDREKILGGIRSEFNQFDQRINRTKHDVSIIQGGKFVKLGSKQHNDATRTHSTVQKSMKMQYDLEKKQHGKTGGLVDRRFGENNKNLSSEDKMLERFTRERQASKKRGAFSLGSDNEDDDDEGFTLTHSGKALALSDDDLSDGEGSGELGGFTTKYVDEDQLEEGPARKKTKAEVMKEVIAKSKFYKKQRQQEFQKTQDNILDLDDDFGDIMAEMANVKTPAAPKFSTKTEEEKAYDSKVRELTYDRRAVPADRTKTDEEIKKEHEEKMKKLETDRLNRMNGLDVDDRGAEADDLDGDFWAGSDEENEDNQEGFEIEEEEQEEDDEDEEGEDKPKRAGLARTLTVVSMPSTHEDFSESLSKIDEDRHPAYINKIIEVYKPNLAEGNKEKMNIFVGILFEHVLYLINQDEVKSTLVEKFAKIIKKLAEAYNEMLVQNVREEINQIQEQILENDGLLRKRDLAFFTIIGYLFSTSDHYHLIVTPTVILMNESISTIAYSSKTSVQRIAQGTFIADTLLNYQKFSKRYIPEVVNFLEKALLLLVPEPTKISRESAKVLNSTSHIIESKLNLSKTHKFKTVEGAINLSDLVREVPTAEFRYQLLVRLLGIVDKAVSLWKDKSTLVEVIDPFITITKHLIKYDASSSTELLNKLVRLKNNLNSDRKPLALQHHKALAIATFAPKFEENFNPDKKSYDVNRERQELNKVKVQLKKEKKAALKDIRQESKFVAREQIEEKKQMYDAYHKKMANIVNSISTVEGAEKNQYEREKKMRKSKK